MRRFVRLRHLFSPSRWVPAGTQPVGPKPHGFWYSCGDEWDRWCASEMPHWITGSPFLYEIEVDESRLLRIQTAPALRAFEQKYSVARYGDARHAIDWAAVAATGVDGIEICPYRGEARWRSNWYYSWDVASGCVWNPRAIRRMTRLTCTRMPS